MMGRKASIQKSTMLERKLTGRMLQVQIIALTLFFCLGIFPWIVYPTFLYVGDAKPLDPTVVSTFAHSLSPNQDGTITIVPNEGLERLVRDYPDIWFYARTRDGASAGLGEVPPEYETIKSGLWMLDVLDIRMTDTTRGGVFVTAENSPAGPVKVMTGNGPVVGVGTMIRNVTIYLVLGVAGVLVIVGAIAIPLIVRRELSGIQTAADQAQRINIDARGTRLPTQRVPEEVRALVDAVNGALARLDESYEKRERFLADSAHELRTPIAILQARIETAAPFPEQGRLLLDVARLASLAGQLLDLQRMDLGEAEMAPVDIVDLAGEAVADLAPLAIASGYELSLGAPDIQIMVQADRTSLLRAFTNLLQNAIAHGGRSGQIVMSIDRYGHVAICDEGPGIPKAERDKVFEPFYRLKPSSSGAGLGLNLVDAIIRRHGGHISIEDGPGGGACFVMTLPVMPVRA